MFKDIMSQTNLMHFAEVGLVIFFVVFAGVCVWAFTRPREIVEKWQCLPLHSGEEGERDHE